MDFDGTCAEFLNTIIYRSRRTTLQHDTAQIHPDASQHIGESTLTTSGSHELKKSPVISAFRAMLYHSADCGIVYSPRSAQALACAVTPTARGATGSTCATGSSTSKLTSVPGYGTAVCRALAHRAELGANLHRSIRARALEACQMALDSGADPNTRNQFGWTPLHLAAQNGSLSLCKMLLAARADATAVTVVPVWDEESFTPLALVQHAVCQCRRHWKSRQFRPTRGISQNQRRMVKLLLEHSDLQTHGLQRCCCWPAVAETDTVTKELSDEENLA